MISIEEIIFKIVSFVVSGGFCLLACVLLYWGGRHIFNGKNLDK